MSAIDTSARFVSPEIEELAEWESAAKVLDLEPGFVARVRRPKLEFSYREFATTREPVTLFIAADEICGAGCTAYLQLGPHVSAGQTEKRFQEVVSGSTLNRMDRGCAAIGVRLPADLGERDLWALSREISPIVSRVLGAARILPGDLKAAVFADWMGHAPLYSGERLESPRVSPQLYWDRRQRMVVLAMVHWCALALQENHKRLRGAAAIALGCSARMNSIVSGLVQQGLRMVGVADESGGLVTGGDVDWQQLATHLNAGGLVAELAHGQHVLASSVANLTCDLVLVEPGIYRASDITHRTGVPAAIVAVDDGRASGSTLPDGVLALPASYMDCLGMLLDLPTFGSDDLALMALEPHLKSLWGQLKAIRTRFGVQVRTATLLLILQRLAQRESLRHP